MNEHLNDALPADDLRRRRFKDLDGFEASWLVEREHLALNPSHEEVLRDAKCAEVTLLIKALFRLLYFIYFLSFYC